MKRLEKKKNDFNHIFKRCQGKGYDQNEKTV